MLVRAHNLRARVGRVVAAGVTVAALFGGVGVAQAASSFWDVTASTPHREDIVWLAGRGVSGGYADGSFRGMNVIVRQDMAAFLYKLAGSPSFDADGALAKRPFRDVSRSTPHWQAILWANSVGVMQGYPDGSFGGMRTVVRQDMAAMLHRYAGWAGLNPSQDAQVSFTDLGRVAHRQDVEWFGATGIAGGFPDGSFGGMRGVVRQDMAAFLHRMVGDGTPTVPDPDKPTQPDKPTGPTEPDKPTEPTTPDKPTEPSKPSQAELDAAKQAVTDAQAKVDKADTAVKNAQADAGAKQAAYDKAEAQAKDARKQIARGSLGFYESMGYTQAVSVITKATGKEGGVGDQTRKALIDQSWYADRLGTDAGGTSLNAMMAALPLYQKINEARVAEGVGELQVSPREEALAQAAFAHQQVQPGHGYYDASQNLGEFHSTYVEEKVNWEAAVAKDPSLAKYRQDWNGLYSDPNYSYDLKATVGHYLGMTQSSDTAFGLAAWAGKGNADDALRVANFAPTKFITDGYNQMEDYVLLTLDLVPVSEYTAKLTAYVDGLNAQVKPADDAKAQLDTAKATLTDAQTTLTDAQNALKDARAKLDALTKA